MPPPDAPSSEAPRSPLRTVVILIVVAAIGGLGFLGARWWWREQELRPSTADALVNANYVAVRPQVTGIVKSIAVRENQVVKAGEPLFEIDPAPFEQALAQAVSELAVVKAEVASDASTITAARAQADMSKQAVDQSQAAATYAKVIFDDTNKLNAAGEATDKELAQAKSSLDQANAALALAKATLARDEARLAFEVSRIGDPQVEQARIAKAQAALDLAKINLGYTRVTAPTDGHVTRFDLRAGQVVSSGETLFYLIESGEWWIDSNFKETQLARIRPGMPATVTLDLYPDVTFDGTVESISRGSAAAFSLLPPENATGNWVKVTQRMTVRVRVKDSNADAPLRLGANATVTIDTTAPAAPNATP
jgi:membrane fusion protein (multidrug efflux system)